MGIFVVLLSIFFCVPIILTVVNTYFLFTKKSFHTENISDCMTFVLGVGFTLLLFFMCSFVEWNVAVVYGEKLNFSGQSYTPISFAHMPTFLTFCVIAILSYIILRLKKSKLPPLMAAFCIAGIFIGFIVSVIFTIQLANSIQNISVIMFLLFPLNIILCSVRLLREVINQVSEEAKSKVYKNKILKLCNKILLRSMGLIIFSFVLMLPIVLFAVIILILFGQQPDSAIKAFTETAEWTLSQKIPPPRLEYDGHYLCTVAVCGDEKTVKPLRAGVRNGKKIIVNRQLLVANAFEDLIKEKTPRFQKQSGISTTNTVIPFQSILPLKSGRILFI